MFRDGVGGSAAFAAIAAEAGNIVRFQWRSYTRWSCANALPCKVTPFQYGYSWYVMVAACWQWLRRIK